MKTIVADYQYRITCLRIVPLLADPIYLTDHIHDIAFPSGHVYKSDSGYEFTGNASESNLTPGTMDIEGIIGLSGISREAVASGALDGASLYIFDTVWTAPQEDHEPRIKAILGKATLRDDRYTIEAMSLIDALNQPIGKTFGATCPKRFGGQEFAGCKVDLGSVTVSGAVSAVADRYTFTAGGRTEAADWFGAGMVDWLTGANVGLKPLEIKRYEADGTVELYEAFFYPVQIGDTYRMIPGCRKRQEDCRDKWNNILNFGGFTRVPVSETYTQRGTK